MNALSHSASGDGRGPRARRGDVLAWKRRRLRAWLEVTSSEKSVSLSGGCVIVEGYGGRERAAAGSRGGGGVVDAGFGEVSA